MNIFEMRAERAKILDASKAFLSEGKIAEAQAKFDEAQKINDSITLAEKLDAEEKAEVLNKAETKPQLSLMDRFGADVKKSFRASYAGQSEGTAADGGYTVPADVQTKINEYMQAKANLMDYITVENVKTLTGSRIYAVKDGQVFSAVNEAAAIGALNKRTFTPVNYSIVKYSGIIPTTNELLADSDAAFAQFLINWLADCKRKTVNSNVLTLAKSNGGSATSIASADDIKAVLNATLGATYKPTSILVTNDDGINWLDSLKYGDGHYILNYDVTKPNQMRFTAGGISIPVVNIPNADMESTAATQLSAGSIPMLIGDLKAGITMFDRQQMMITRSDTATVDGVSAFENDLTYIRGAFRADFELVDGDAFVNCEVEIPQLGN